MTSSKTDSYDDGGDARAREFAQRLILAARRYRSRPPSDMPVGPHTPDAPRGRMAGHAAFAEQVRRRTELSQAAISTPTPAVSAPAAKSRPSAPAMAHTPVHVARKVVRSDDAETAPKPDHGESWGGADKRSPRPSLRFAGPPPSAGDVGEPTAPASSDALGGGSGAGQADADAVASRVYELMKQEIVLGRERGAGAGRY